MNIPNKDPMQLKWTERRLIGEDGFTIVSVTDQTPQDVFDRFKLEVNKHLDELGWTATQFEEQRRLQLKLSRTPTWSIRREGILKACAKVAGMKDT